LSGFTSARVLTKYFTGLMAAIRDCAAAAAFGPGLPSLSTMPFESELATCWPRLGI
jgi:hypothetical protein